MYPRCRIRYLIHIIFAAYIEAQFLSPIEHLNLVSVFPRFPHSMPSIGKAPCPDLWEQLLALTDRHQLRYHWVKGHAENPYNNRCDEMAVAESRKFKA